jgi:hypothetical protein
MYLLLHELLADKKGGEVFTLFSTWHFFYIILTVTAIALILILAKNRHIKEKISKIFINVAFALYILDLFLMPLAYGEINIENLPFHVCTASCVLCFLSYHSSFLARYRSSIVILGFISNLVYLIYPAGIMWYAVHPLSYRVIQSLLLHSSMTVYGALTLSEEITGITKKSVLNDLKVLVTFTAWALIGNYAYNADTAEYSHFFNWFFVVRDPFYLIPKDIAPFIMPALNIALFFMVETLIRIILSLLYRIKRKGKLYEN